MNRIAGMMTFASFAFIAHSCAHLEVHFGAPRTPLALHQVQDDAVAGDSLISNGIDGGRPPAEHVDD